LARAFVKVGNRKGAPQGAPFLLCESLGTTARRPDLAFIVNLISGSPFWPIKSGLIASYPALAENVSCEMAIIGGGISGALVAHALCNEGVDTVLLDRRDVGFGSTAASTALLQYEIDTPLHQLVELVGLRNAVHSYTLCRDAIYKLEQIVEEIGCECGFRRTESLFLAKTKSEVRLIEAEYEARVDAGFDVEYWPREKIKRESSLPYAAAILSKDAAEVDAYRLTHGLLCAAVKKGLRIYDRTCVTAYDRRERSVRLETDRKFAVRAKYLTIATGYEAQQHIPQNLTSLHSTFAVISEPLKSFSGWPGRRILWETKRPYFYLRTTEDQRALIGGADEEFQNPDERARLLPKKMKVLQRKFKQLFPSIEFEPAYGWAGTFAETKDGLPFIGQNKCFPRAFFALGYGGNGITYSVTAAEIIRDLYFKRGSIDARLFDFERLKQTRM
jgi:glycine/D-amino acid oxidase-like deaminating enzyme